MIKDKANRLIRKYKTRDPFILADELDVILLYVPLKGVNGFYNYYKRNHIIYINNSLDNNKRRLVLAHELGHLILHKNTNTVYLNKYTRLITQKYEIEADIFASELLIDDEVIMENKDKTIDQLAKMLCIDAKFVEYKLQNM